MDVAKSVKRPSEGGSVIDDQLSQGKFDMYQELQEQINTLNDKVTSMGIKLKIGKANSILSESDNE